MHDGDEMNKTIGQRLKKPKHLSEEVADILKSELDKGVLKPGEKLPTEMELAKNFGVSRTVIREALSRLRYDGLLDTRQGSGAVVAEPKNRKSFRLETSERLSKKNFQHLMEMRIIVESQTAFLAAQRRTKAGLSRMEKNLEAMNEANQQGKNGTKPEDGTKPDLKFHLEIAKSTKNTYLADFLEYLNEKLGVVIQASREKARGTGDTPQKVQNEHQAIFDAIQQKKPELARKAMIAHISNTAYGMDLQFTDLALSDTPSN